MINVAKFYPGASIDTITFFATCSRTVRKRPVLTVKDIKYIPEHLSLQAILDDICKVFEVKPEFIRKRERDRQRVALRRIFYWAASNHTEKTQKEIGAFIGHQDRTTVIHQLAQMKNAIDTSDKYFIPVWTKYLSETKIPL